MRRIARSLRFFRRRCSRSLPAISARGSARLCSIWRTSTRSVPNLSILYRHAMLARSLRISVADLVTLKGLSGLDPFAPLKPEAITALADDHPFTSTIRLLDAVDRVKASGYSIEELDYL